MLPANTRIIKTFEREDGKARIHILSRSDGFFSFVGEAEEEEYGDRYWAPSDGGGFYASAEEAELGAMTLVPWLRQQRRNNEQE